MQEKERIEKVYEKVMELIHTTNELGELYPEKSFKLDGILLGNIGEVLASYLKCYTKVVTGVANKI